VPPKQQEEIVDDWEDLSDEDKATVTGFGVFTSILCCLPWIGTFVCFYMTCKRDRSNQRQIKQALYRSRSKIDRAQHRQVNAFHTMQQMN